MNRKNVTFFVLLFLFCRISPAFSSGTQLRMDKDIESGKPVVIQVCVALADNKHQWIVPVPEHIGNGQDAQSNLYWGARYGLKTYMTRDGRWEKVASLRTQDPRILERLILKKQFLRQNKQVSVYMVADAWDGKYINNAIQQFLNFNAGHDVIDLEIEGGKIQAGGKAHLIVYMGHNALMDYGGAKNALLFNPKQAISDPVNDAMVFACSSEAYFLSRLEEVDSHPLVLTTGLMAPEAYSLDSAVEEWITGADDTDVRKAAARRYNAYQKTGQKAAERLFGVQRHIR